MCHQEVNSHGRRNMCHCAAFLSHLIVHVSPSPYFLFSRGRRQDKEGLYPLTVNSVMTDPHALVLYAVPHVIQVRALLCTLSPTSPAHNHLCQTTASQVTLCHTLSA